MCRRRRLRDEYRSYFCPPNSARRRSDAPPTARSRTRRPGTSPLPRARRRRYDDAQQDHPRDYRRIRAARSADQADADERSCPTTDEAYCDRLDLGLLDGGDGFLYARFVQRFHLALWPHPLLHGEAQLAWDEGGRVVLSQVVKGGVVLARYLQHVSEPFRRHERRPGAAAFEQGVRSHRHTVGQSVHHAWLYLRGLYGVHHARGLVLR